jgi:hypothetical protein
MNVLPLSESDRTETDDGGHAATLTLKYLRRDEEEGMESMESVEENAEEGNKEEDPKVVPEGRDSRPQEELRQ